MNRRSFIAATVAATVVGCAPITPPTTQPTTQPVDQTAQAVLNGIVLTEQLAYIGITIEDPALQPQAAAANAAFQAVVATLQGDINASTPLTESQIVDSLASVLAAVVAIKAQTTSAKAASAKMSARLKR
jgi:hypothetical protein